MLDYIIVGGGLAGLAFAETALEKGKKVMVFNDTSQTSSKVAAGLYNPVILKRFTQVWQANEQLALMHAFFGRLEQRFQLQFNHRIPLLRRFYSVEEQNDWFTASDKPNLSAFLSPKLIHEQFNAIDSPFGFGEVLHSGFVDTELLLKTYHNYLNSLGSLSLTTFDYDALRLQMGSVLYKDLTAKHIVFAEGFGMTANPFFFSLPLDGAKGELLLIKAPDLDLKSIIKTDIFILPLGNHIYKVGATYNWEDKTNTPTQAAKDELLAGLKEVIHCDFEVIDHLAGIRPTVKDRRPMIGTHPQHPNVHLLNGLGTRGVMLAPAMAQLLFDHIENGATIDNHISIRRFRDFGVAI